MKSSVFLKIFIVSFPLLFCLNAIAQTDTNFIKRKLIISTSLENILFILPHQFTFSINDYKLHNRLNFSLFTKINMFQAIFPSFETGYRHYFFNKLGVFTETGYACYMGKFQFVKNEGTYFKYGNKYPYKEYVTFSNLQFLKFQTGIFYRYTKWKYGILELNVNGVFQYPTNFSNRYLRESQYNILYHFYPNFEIGYYFKRNRLK